MLVCAVWWSSRNHQDPASNIGIPTLTGCKASLIGSPYIYLLCFLFHTLYLLVDKIMIPPKRPGFLKAAADDLEYLPLHVLRKLCLRQKISALFGNDGCDGQNGMLEASKDVNYGQFTLISCPCELKTRNMLKWRPPFEIMAKKLPASCQPNQLLIIRSREMQVNCDQCDSKVTSKDILKYHMKTKHEGLKLLATWQLLARPTSDYQIQINAS